MRRYEFTHGLPCKHALALTRKLGIARCTLVKGYLTTAAWKATYNAAGSPSVVAMNTLAAETVLAPRIATRTGRPRKERMTGRASGTQKCSKCGEKGHNVRSCTASSADDRNDVVVDMVVIGGADMVVIGESDGDDGGDVAGDDGSDVDGDGGAVVGNGGGAGGHAGAVEDQ